MRGMVVVREEVSAGRGSTGDQLSGHQERVTESATGAEGPRRYHQMEFVDQGRLQQLASHGEDGVNSDVPDRSVAEPLDRRRERLRHGARVAPVLEGRGTQLDFEFGVHLLWARQSPLLSEQAEGTNSGVEGVDAS